MGLSFGYWFYDKAIDEPIYQTRYPQWDVNIGHVYYESPRGDQTTSCSTLVSAWLGEAAVIRDDRPSAMSIMAASCAQRQKGTRQFMSRFHYLVPRLPLVLDVDGFTGDGDSTIGVGLYLVYGMTTPSDCATLLSFWLGADAVVDFAATVDPRIGAAQQNGKFWNYIRAGLTVYSAMGEPI